MAMKFPQIKEVRIPALPKVLNILYTPGLTASYAERENILGTRHARRAKVEYKLQNRSKDRLYWTFITETSRSKLPLAAMRNHFRRRWKNAFAKALKHNGLDFRGQKLPVLPGQPCQPALVGTLEVRVFGAAHWEDHDQSKMEQHSNSIVKGLLRLQRSTRN